MISLKKLTDANTNTAVWINPAAVSHVAHYRRWQTDDQRYVFEGTLIHMLDFERTVHVSEAPAHVVAALQGASFPELANGATV